MQEDTTQVQIFIGANNGEEALIKGDVDKDGIVTTKDAKIVLDISTGKITDVSNYSIENAHMNNDNAITDKDEVLILQMKLE